MKNKAWITLALAGLLLVSQAPSAAAENQEASGMETPYRFPSYSLTDDLHVELKSMLNDHSSDEVKLGVVIRVHNAGLKTVNIPDYELKVTTDEGAEYYLLSSIGNSPVIRAKSNEELSYLGVINRDQEIRITQVSLVKVDWYTFPKTEEVVLTMPVHSEWKGEEGDITDAAYRKEWGDEFVIPGIESQLVYMPVSYDLDLTKEQGAIMLVKLRVENRSGKRGKIPVFSLQARTEGTSGAPVKNFEGTRVEKGDIHLEAGEKRYIHYTLPVDVDAQIKHMFVITPEVFKESAKAVSYSVGRVKIALPGSLNEYEQTPAYTLNSVMVFDSANDFIHPELDISMVEIGVHENEALGYRTAIAKFRLFNNSGLPMGLPNFHADLVNANGFTFSGTRQTTALKEITPHASYLVTFAFVLPNTEESERFVLKISDTQSAAPYHSKIGGYQVAVIQDKPPEDLFPTLSVYPFQIKVRDWRIESYFYSGMVPSANRFSYKMNVNLDLSRGEDIIVDDHFSKLRFELRDPINQILGTKDLSFIGKNKMVSGKQTFYFDDIKTDQTEFPLSVYVYEVIQTPMGEAKRLLTVFKQ
ncbi:MAG: hypothetical protein K0S39_5582 [Paenibacillus sp.]|nr:hypothetical protein [Paenibacillus sp.]